MKRQYKKKVMASVLALAMLLSTLPVETLAEGTEDSTPMTEASVEAVPEEATAEEQSAEPVNTAAEGTEDSTPMTEASVEAVPEEAAAEEQSAEPVNTAAEETAAAQDTVAVSESPEAEPESPVSDAEIPAEPESSASEEETPAAVTDTPSVSAGMILLEDPDTGISVSLGEADLPQGVTADMLSFNVTMLTEAEETALISGAYSDCLYEGYDLTLTDISTGEAVEPTASVEVSFPAPAEFGSDILVLHLKNDGTEELSCTVETEADGSRNVIFTTDSFSPFAIVDLASVREEDEIMLLADDDTKTPVSFEVAYDGSTIIAGDSLASHYSLESVTYSDGTVEQSPTQTVTSPNYPSNYPNGCTESENTTVVSFPGASSMTITFSADSKLESVKYDWVRILDKNGNQVAKYGGTDIAGKTLTVEGDSVSILFRSDSSGTYKGFSAEVKGNGAGMTYKDLTFDPERVPTTAGDYTAVVSLTGTGLTKTIDYTVAYLSWQIGSPNASDVTAAYDGNGILIVSGTGATKTFEIPAAYKDKITKLVVNGGVTTLENLCIDCKNLKEVSLPESLITIGRSFDGCASLESVTIPEGVTSLGYRAFYGCTSLTEIDIPDSVTSMESYAFNGCTALEKADLSAGLKGIASYAFDGCTALEDVTIPAGVTTIDNYAFYNCRSLNTAIPSGVTTIGNYAFYKCTSLNTAIPSGVTTIGAYAFYNCTSLTELELPASVTSVGNTAFYGCSGLQTVKIDNDDISLGTYAFAQCSQLTSIDLPANMTMIPDGLLDGCTALTEVEIPANVTSIGVEAFAFDTFTSIDIPDSVTVIGRNAFYQNYSLKDVKMPSGLKTISTQAFIQCTSLENIDLPEGLESIDSNAFNGCSSLKEIMIPDSVTTLGQRAFSACSLLKEVTIGSGVTSDLAYVFAGDSALTKATIRNSVLSANEFQSTSLNELVLDGDLTSVSPKSLTTGSGGELAVTVTQNVSAIPADFWTALSARSDKSVSFTGENVLTITGISGAGLGSPYNNLKDGTYYVDAAGNLWYLDTDNKTAELSVVVEDSASFTIPTTVNGDYTVTGVGCNAFYQDPTLTTVTFETPANITTVAPNAFLNRTNLISINGLNSTDDINALFAPNASIGLDAYRNTGLDVNPTYTETKDKLMFQDSDGKGPTVTISTTTTSTLDTDPDKFNLYTGETLNVLVNITNKDNTVSGEKIRVYLQFDNADGEVPYASESEWNVEGDNGQVYKLRVTKEENNRYCLEFEQPEIGDTVSFQFTALYPSPTSAGGDVLVWGDEIKAEELDTFVTNPTKVQRAHWTTKADDWTLKKSAYNASSVKLYSSEALGDTAYLRKLAYAYSLTRNGNTQEYIGKDYMEYVEFTDILTLPDGYEFNPDIVKEIEEGNIYLATGSSRPASEESSMYWSIYCKVGGTAYNIASLYSSYSSGSVIDAVHYDAEIVDDSHIKIVWRVPNQDLSTEIQSISSTAYRIMYGYWLIQCDMITGVPENTVSDFVNDITADQKFSYSENQTDTASATAEIKSGRAVLDVVKSGTGSTRSGKADFSLKVVNTGSYPYRDYGSLEDMLPSDFFIAPEDIETMFADTSFGYDVLTLTITNATLCDTLSDVNVTMSDGSTAVVAQQQLQGTNTQSEDSIQSLYGAVQTTDENQKTNNASMTITRNAAGKIAVTVNSGADLRTYVVGEDGTLAEIFDSIGFMVTDATQYKCVWDYSKQEDTLIIYGSASLIYAIPAHVKSSFMKINVDTATRQQSVREYTKNYAYVYAKSDSSQIDYDYTNSYITYEFAVSSSISVDGTVIREGENISDNTVLDQTVIVKHTVSTGEIDYSVTPIVKKLTGTQVLMAEVSANPDLAGEGFTVIKEDGVSYYLINKAGEYHNISINGSVSDTVIVEDSGSGKNTLIKWYENFNGVSNITKNFKTYLSRAESGLGDSAFYGIGGMAWLGDHEAHRLYTSDPGITGSVITFDKNIVTNAETSTGPDADELAEKSFVHEGESVTYRLDLRYILDPDDVAAGASETRTVTLSGSDIQDKLPLSIAGYRWTKGTSVSIRYQDGENVTVKNPDSWKISYVDRNGVDYTGNGQQFIRWNDDFTITFSDRAYIYVTLVFPDSDAWVSYAQAFGADTLINTFYLHELYASVTHELGVTAEAYLNKGVVDAGWMKVSEYYSSSDVLARQVYETNDSVTRIIQYYGTVYNSGDTRLYLDTLYDVLPEGFTYQGLANNVGSLRGYVINNSSCYLNTNSGTLDGTSLFVYDTVTVKDDDRSSVAWKSATVTSAIYDTTDDGRQIVSFDFTGSTTDSRYLSYDSEKGKYYLNPGEGLVFGYLVNPGEYDTSLPTVRTNGLMMQFYDYTGSGLVISDLGEDGGITAKPFSSKEQNDGICEEKTGIEVTADYGIPSRDASQWMYSEVSMTTGEVMPGITKKTVSVKKPTGATVTDFTSVEPKDKVTWELQSENSGEKGILNYSVTDVMPSPYEFEGDVKYKILMNSGTVVVNGTLFTIADRKDGDTEVTITYTNHSGGTSTMSIPLDGTPMEVPLRILTRYYNYNKARQEYLDTTVTVVMKKDDKGNSVISVTFPDKNMSLPEGGTSVMTVTTVNPTTKLACKVYTNRCYITPLSQDFDHDGVTQGNYVVYDEKDAVRNSAPLTVAYGYISSAVKSVTEISDPTNTAKANDSKNYITLSAPDSLFRYALIVDNTTQKSMSKLVIIDNLPKIGDSATFDSLDERGSAFKVDFADELGLEVSVWDKDRKTSTVLTADQYTVEFSDKSSGFTDDDWDGTTTWNAAKTADSRSLRIKILDETGNLIPRDYHVEIRFNAKVDMNQFNDTNRQEDYAGKIAWNSFGYDYRRLGDDYDLQAAPEKVGVQFQCYPYLQKKLADASGDYTTGEDRIFTFVVHDGNALSDYTDNAKTSASGRSIAVVQLTVPAGQSASEVLLLKPSLLKTKTWDADKKQWVEDGGSLTWTDGEKYTIAEISIPYNYESAVFSGQTGNAVTFTYTNSNKTVYKCTNTLREGKVSLTKLNSDSKTPLAGVTFEITGENGFKTQTKTTGTDGTLEFKNLPEGNYKITEIRTAEGKTLLSEPIEVTIPLSMTEDEISAKEEESKISIDRSKAVYDEESGTYYFYNFSYEVTNSSNLVLPVTGADTWMLYVAFVLALLAMTGCCIFWLKRRCRQLK